MLNKLVAMLVIIASTERILAQAQNASSLFPPAAAQAWEMPVPPTQSPYVPSATSNGLAANVKLPSPVFSPANLDFLGAGPNVEGTFAKSVLAPAMGVRSDAIDWQQINNNPGNNYASKGPEPLYYRPTVAYVAGAEQVEDLPRGLTIPMKPYTPSLNKATVPPSWDIMVDPVVPLPPLLPSAPVPPLDPAETRAKEAQANAVLMEIQSKAVMKQKQQLLQQQQMELEKLRETIRSQPVPTKTVTTTTYYSNPMEAVLKEKEAAYMQAQQEQAESSSFVETKTVPTAASILDKQNAVAKPRVAGKPAKYHTKGSRRISYNRYKRDFILHNNPESNSALYEVNALHNTIPSETLGHHLPAGWREQSFVDNFTGVKPEDKITNEFGKLKDAYEQSGNQKSAVAKPATSAGKKPVVTKPATSAGKKPVVTKPATAAVVATATASAKPVNAVAKASKKPTKKPVKAPTDTTPTLVKNPSSSDKAPLVKEVLPQPPVAAPSSSFLATEEDRYRVISPIVPHVITYERMHPVTSSRSGRHVGFTPMRHALRNADRRPVYRKFSTVPKTRMGMLSEFIRLNQQHPRTKVIRRNNALPFGGSFIETEEEPVFSNQRPFGIPRRTSMRPAPRR